MNTKPIKKENRIVREKKKYSVVFKKKIIQEYLTGLKNAQDIHREYGIRFTLLNSWYKWYQNHFMNYSNEYRIMKTKKTEDKARLLELESKIIRLKEALEKEKLRADAMEHLVDLTKQYHNIDLKKSTGNK